MILIPSIIITAALILSPALRKDISEILFELGELASGVNDIYAGNGRWGGHCTDLNSCFVALCRANGIAAREMFGIRLNDISNNGQHCWAEFYLPGEGWTCADPGDVLKQAREVTGSDRSKEAIENARKDPTVIAKKKDLWLGVDGNRVVLNRGRDVVLNPAQKGESGRNTFGYPYAEMNGQHKLQMAVILTAQILLISIIRSNALRYRRL